MAKSRKPFHESLVDTIHHVANGTGMSSMALLARLIKETDIPKGHDQILTAWNQLRERHGYPDGSVDILHVIADLEEQKEEVTTKEAAKAARPGCV